MSMNKPPRTSIAVFAKGDVVRIRDEPSLSVVELPTDRQPDCVPEDVPDLGALCCVPIALVRTPPVEDGVLRWVELSDLVRVEDENSNTEPTIDSAEEV